MARPKRQPADGPSQDWMVTFSDCMTLLLTFFVMLLSFSSFDPEDLDVLRGMLNEPSNPSVQPVLRTPKENPVDPAPNVVDRTEEGAEKPDFDRLDPTERPREPLDVLSRDAYRDRRVLSIPSDLLFWGLGAQLKPEAETLLGPVADYLRLVSSQVVLSEAGAAPDEDTRAAEDRAAKRLAVLVKYFTRTENLEADRFNLSASDGVLGTDPATPAAGPVVRIAILNPRVYP